MAICSIAAHTDNEGEGKRNGLDEWVHFSVVETDACLLASLCQQLSWPGHTLDLNPPTDWWVQHLTLEPP